VSQSTNSNYKSYAEFVRYFVHVYMLTSTYSAIYYYCIFVKITLMKVWILPILQANKSPESAHLRQDEYGPDLKSVSGA